LRKVKKKYSFLLFFHCFFATLPVMDYMEYSECRICPKNCGAPRNRGAAGYCGETADLRLAGACLHFGEEPPLTGRGGSGTVFVTGCNLRCPFCQNYQISQSGMGRAVSIEEFARICLALLDGGAENINIVTGSHAVPALAEGIRAAKKAGLHIPVCWNSSGYESVPSLAMLDGLVDIWLPDLKTLNPRMAQTLFSAPDYPQVAKEAIRYMLDSAPLCMTAEGSMKQGVIVRHLFLPGCLEDTIQVLDWLKKNLTRRGYVSLMTQYTPVPAAAGLEQCGPPGLPGFENRLVSQEESQGLTTLLEAYNFEHLFYQELTQDTDWLPDFSRRQPFSNVLAKPVWHWKD
jgi:putative pyruvate formate lyase activating enzyme